MFMADEKTNVGALDDAGLETPGIDAVTDLMEPEDDYELRQDRYQELSDEIDMRSFATDSFVYTQNGGRDEFWVVDYDEFESYLKNEVPEGKEYIAVFGGWNIFGELCDLQFQCDSWGTTEDFLICFSCGSAINIGDYYNPDIRFDSDYYGGYICAHCVKDNPGEYLGELSNSPTEANEILSDDDLEALGYELIKSWDRYDRHDEYIRKCELDDFLSVNPNGEAIFDDVDHFTFRMWAKTSTLSKRDAADDDEM